jgi:membrane protease YdiL (CAAX protease family)
LRATAFVLLTFICSWTPWVALIATTGDPLVGPASTALWVAGGYGPTIAALLTAALLDGRAGLRHLFVGLRRWRLGRWYLALVLPLPVALAAALVTVATGPANLEIAGLGHWGLLPAMLLGGVLLGGLEEVGWRGYLLPRLQPSIGPIAASIVIGLVWSLWHAPLFLLTSTSQASLSPTWFTLHAVALSLVLTWLYNGSGGSVLLTVLFHGVVNGAYDAVIGGVAPGASETFLVPATVVLAAIAAVPLIRRRRLRATGQARTG